MLHFAETVQLFAPCRNGYLSKPTSGIQAHHTQVHTDMEVPVLRIVQEPYDSEADSAEGVLQKCIYIRKGAESYALALVEIEDRFLYQHS